MASTAQEQAFLDGTHPALSGNAAAMDNLRSTSPARSTSPSSTAPSSPRFTAIDPDPTTSGPPPPLRNNAYGATNTGPKGVLADYATSRTSSNTGPKGVLADYQGNPLSLGLSPPMGGDDWETQLDAGLDDDDHEALERYRRQRIAELSGSGTRGPSGTSNVKKTFGHLREITEGMFLSALEEGEEVAVVLHLYESGIEACNVLNQHLSTLARAYPHTKFLRALATEVDFAANTEDDALPTVLVYRTGELETTLVRLDRDWGRGTRGELEELLLKSGAISESAGYHRISTSSRRPPPSSDSDDD